MELRTKRLLSLWDHKTYTNRARPLDKPIDGLFVYQSLFSVEAFASTTRSKRHNTTGEGHCRKFVRKNTITT